jgi:serine/threonine protein kinase
MTSVTSLPDELKACESFAKRVRSLSPSDEKISKVAKSCLAQEEPLKRIQRMFDWATYKNPKIIKSTDLVEAKYLYEVTAGRVDSLFGWRALVPLAEGGENRAYPFITDDAEYVVLTSKHNLKAKQQPPISQKVGKESFLCKNVPLDYKSDDLFSENSFETLPIFHQTLIRHANRGDLRSFIRRQLPTCYRNCLPNLGLQLLEKLYTLHQEGGAHCDIKPANLLVDLEEENLKLSIADFGHYSESAIGWTRCGTPGYRGPEAGDFFSFFDVKIPHHEALHASMYDAKLLDLYATGTTLFELLTKKSFPSQISEWFTKSSTFQEKAKFYSVEDFKTFRQSKVEAFLTDFISKSAEGAWIRNPYFGQVISGLIQEEPINRMPLDQAIAIWKQGVQSLNLSP